MELDTKRKLIIGALDPRHNDAEPRHGGARRDGSSVATRTAQRLLRHLLRRSEQPRQVGDFVDCRRATRRLHRDCKYIWTGGPARRTWTGSARSSVRCPARSRPALVGDGRPIWVTDLRDRRTRGLRPAGRPLAQRPHRLLPRRRRGRARDRVGHRPRRHPRLRHEGRHRDPYQNRAAGEAVPILIGRRRPRGRAAPGVRPTLHTPRADGPAGSGRGVKGTSCRTEEDFCRRAAPDRRSTSPDSWGGEPVAQTPRDPLPDEALDSFHPFLDTPETANPALGCSAHYFEIEAARRRLVRPGPAAGGHQRRADLRQVGYYRVTGTSRRHNPSSNSWDVAFGRPRRAGSAAAGADLSTCST